MLLILCLHCYCNFQPAAVASNAKMLANTKQVTSATANKKPQSDSDSDSDSSSSDGSYLVFHLLLVVFFTSII